MTIKSVLTHRLKFRLVTEKVAVKELSSLARGKKNCGNTEFEPAANSNTDNAPVLGNTRKLN